MDRVLKGFWELLKALFGLALGLVMLGLAAVGMGLVFWAGESAVSWVKAPRDCARPTRTVSELLAAAEGGHLFARRAALYELPCAVPKTPSELELLSAAGGQGRRKRLRAGALASIRRVGAQEAALAPRLRALLGAGDPAVAEAAFDAARNLGLDESHPDLAAFLARRPDLRRPAAAPPAAAADPAAAERYHARAVRVQAVVSRADPSRYLALREAALGTPSVTTESLLADPSFVFAGTEAGRVLVQAGRLSSAAARALATGDDLVLQDVGLGALRALGDEAALEDALGRRGARP